MCLAKNIILILPQKLIIIFDKNGIPLVSYNNNNIYFPVTVINYFIGMLDSKNLQ